MSLGTLYSNGRLCPFSHRVLIAASELGVEIDTCYGRDIPASVREAVEEGGTTIRDYATPEGDFGYFAIRLDAYGRQGKPCCRCGAPLRAEVIAGRTTAFCPGCQR